MSEERVATLKEEIANATTHGIGLLASLIGLPILVLTAEPPGRTVFYQHPRVMVRDIEMTAAAISTTPALTRKA